MKTKTFLIALLFVSVAQAKEPKAHQSGTSSKWTRRSAVWMKTAARALSAKSWAPIRPIRRLMPCSARNTCLQSDTVIYRIRPVDEKHPVLLPVGQTAQFRIHKDKMLLQVEDADGKEREYSVISMTPRAERKSADNSNSPKSVTRAAGIADRIRACRPSSVADP